LIKQRVVVTGMGVVSPLGTDIKTFWSNLTQGTSGAGPITRFDPAGFNTRIAAEVKNFNPADFIDKKELRRMDRFTHFALAATKISPWVRGFRFDQGGPRPGGGSFRFRNWGT